MNSRPIKIYTVIDAPRLKYIADIIIWDMLGLSYEIVTDKRKLGKNPVINYSTDEISGSFKINPDKLLFETDVRTRDIIVSEWKGLPVFFQTTADSDFPFDIFAASFFLVSRYEEYLEFQPDEYGRFQASSSIAFKHGFLSIPVIDLWTKELAKTLLRKFQTLAFKRNEFKALLTVDIDQPFAWLGKNVFGSVGGLFRDLINKTGNAGDRYNCIARGEKDPYDVFDYIIENIEKYGSDVRFFIPVGDHSTYDNYPSWKNEEYRKFIIRISDKFKTGLHPSFLSANSLSLINTEMLRLKSIILKDILSCRFHYLKLKFPGSYNNLVKTGIEEDYSMGYPDEPGFRAGIARPFNFYDISEDRKTNLKIIPFQVMDGTFHKYKDMTALAAKEVIGKLIDDTKKAGGLFVSIWHNTSLLDNKECQGWKEVFEYMLKRQLFL
jgi:hypothetical protein